LLIGKGKAIPLQVWTCPEGSGRMRLLDFKTRAREGGKVVSPNAPATFTPNKYSWYSFLLQTESTPGP